MAKLTAADVRDIRAARQAGTAQAAVARRFHVDPATIRRLVNRHTWKHVQ